MNVRLSAENLSVCYDQHTVVKDLSLTFPDGQFTAIIGANGCGKSTLLRALARLQPLAAGCVFLGDDDITKLNTRHVARRLGLLPQGVTAPAGLTVSELVARGRFPHQNLLGQWSQEDARACNAALLKIGMEQFASRPLGELSGGQRQRAWIGTMIAQDPQILLLDEPTAHLDVVHQIELLELLTELRTEGRTIIAVLHELNMAFRYADHLIAVKNGKVIAQGAPADVVSEGLIQQVFGLNSVIMADPITGRPMMVPAPTSQDQKSI